MRSTCPRFPTVRPWKPSKRRALSSGCTCAEDDPFWRPSWKSNCSKGLKVIKPWMIDNRIPMTNHLAEVYAITHLRCTPFFYPPTFSVYQEIWNPAVVVVTEGKGNQSSKYLLWPLKKHVSQSLDLSTGGGVMAGKAVKGDWRKEIADYQVPWEEQQNGSV